MPISLVPGNALGCAMNAHRSRWDGSICESAASWNCGAESYFREDYCERQVPRCFHMHAFDADNPHFVIPNSGIGWMLDENAEALQDQVLIFWGPQFTEPRGIREGQPRTHVCFGAYRIQSVERSTAPGFPIFRLIPYPEGWADFHDLHVPRPYYQTAGGTYVKQIDRRTIERTLKDALETSEKVWSGAEHEDRARRLENFTKSIGSWLDVAAKRAERFVRPRAVAPPPVQSGSTSMSRPSSTMSQPFKSAQAMRILEERVKPAPKSGEVTDESVTATSPTAPTKRTTAKRPQTRVEAILEPLVEEDAADFLEANYGSDISAAVQVAALTKPIIGLRGEPGVGKSTLALNLLNDPKRERTIVIPVASTWRGREDLLGYASPIDNQFDATPFTRFLYKAQEAWDAGDFRNHLVIFEEFNLAQPEFWLSDVLVRSQYPDTARAERTIELGGTAIRGLADVSPVGVFLSPAVRFVATLNTDHTTRPLSPRVLDRLAIVELSLDPQRAIERAGVTLAPEAVEAIATLTFCLKNKGGNFSYRTALSLKTCHQRLQALGIDENQALDLILQQEVLTKVRLMAGDPADHQVIRELNKWADTTGSSFTRCTATIATWKEALDEGLDVTQV